MPYQTSPEIDFSSIGLMVDVPANQIPQGGWSNSLNVRCRNGSVQGVNTFADDIALWHTAGDIANGEAKAVCQFTPAGGLSLVLAYIVKRANGGAASVILYNTGGSGDSRWQDITNATTSQVFTFDDSYPPQIFVFNELLIVNPGTDAPPQYTTATVGAGSLQEIPNWVHDVEANATNSIVDTKKYTIISLGDTTAAQWITAGVPSGTTAAVGVVFTADSTTTVAGTGTVKLSNPIIARVVKPFNNRLVAMNIKEERGSEDDVFMPIDFLWSSHVTTISSLADATWTSATTNTAGDAFLLDTPGKILDGGQLGEFFIAYKSDGVVRVRETGDSYILSFESIFEDDGIYSTRCFANIGNSQHLVVGNYGIYIHDGQAERKDIAKDLFKDTMYALVKTTERDRAFVFQQTRDREVWLCLPSTSNSSTGCDLAFVYDYNSGKVHKRTVPGITDMFETELNGELKIYATKSGTTLQTLSNTVLESGGYFERTDDNLTDNSKIKCINRIHVNAKGSCLLALTGTQNLSDSKSYTNVAFNPATQHKVDTRTSGRYMNLKVTMDGATNPELTKLQFDIRMMGVK
tara:strand:+ start:209 stop:1939 length:1731 start_codon:yes stop_codon:yes gene_type:complete